MDHRRAEKHLAVETGVQQYADAIDSWTGPDEQDFAVSVKPVAYRDCETDPVPEVPFTERYFSKRSISEYEEEQEVRAVFKDYTDGRPVFEADDFSEVADFLRPENVPESH